MAITAWEGGLLVSGGSLVWAEEEVRVGHPVDPAASVDLSNRFLKKVTRQRGDHCSIHATSALVEAACFAKTGKRIDLSEASLIADHYRFYLKQPFRTESYPITDAWLRPNREHLEFAISDGVSNHHHASVLSPTGLALTGFDRAYSRQVLTQALLGNVLSESELPTDTGFFEKIDGWVKEWGPQEHVTNHNDIRLWALRDLDQMILGRAQEGGAHFQYASSSSEMRDCLRTANFQVVAGPGKFAIEHQKPDGSRVFETKRVNAPNADDLASYLDQGLPVGCSVDQYAVVTGDRVQVGAHMVVVVGYRKTLDRGLEFRVRDSNFDEHQWIRLTGCNQFQILK